MDSDTIGLLLELSQNKSVRKKIGRPRAGYYVMIPGGRSIGVVVEDKEADREQVFLEGTVINFPSSYLIPLLVSINPVTRNLWLDDLILMFLKDSTLEKREKSILKTICTKSNYLRDKLCYLDKILVSEAS